MEPQYFNFNFILPKVNTDYKRQEQVLDLVLDHRIYIDHSQGQESSEKQAADWYRLYTVLKRGKQYEIKLELLQFFLVQIVD